MILASRMLPNQNIIHRSNGIHKNIADYTPNNKRLIN